MNLSGARSDSLVDVLVATPLGEGGRGGIDRLMDALRLERRDGCIDRCRVRFGVTRGPQGLWLSPLYFARFLARLASQQLRGQIDLVHINLSSHGSAHRKVLLGAAVRALGIPYVVHLHGSRFRSYFDAADARMQRRIRTLFAGAARTIVLGRVWRDYIADRVPEASQRIVILPNASEAITRDARGPDDGVQIVFLGRVGARKGVPDLVDALAGIQELDGWRAVIAGDGEIEETKRRVASLGLSERVSVPGWIGPNEARQMLIASDILVLPSFDENLPMSVIEGLSAGLAVVTTPVGAVEDIVRDGETGLLVAPGDVPALAHALRRVVSDAGLRTRLGEAAQAFHREHLEIGRYAHRLAAIWLEASR